jgi:xanthine dehydrogenase YagS FAD-binding subunit
MKAFEYAQPASLKDAFPLLGTSWGTTEILAGGTDLLSLLKDFVVQPERVVSLQSIPELRGVAIAGAGLSIGAMTTIDELVESAAVAERYPGVLDAARGIKSAQMRAMGTVGGELLQRPRCWYFRRGFGLVAQKDGRDLVADGDSRHHAVLGNDGLAKYVNPSSLAPVLIALGAQAVVASKDGERTVALHELYRVPEQAEGEREITLRPDEILKAIVLPEPMGRSATYEIRHRHGLDWPEAAAACVLAMAPAGDTVRAATIVLGHVAPVPWPAGAAAEALQGKELTDDVLAEAARVAVADARPLRHNGYKIELAQVAVKRALLRAAGKPAEWR